MTEFDSDSIPEELRQRPQWICWKQGKRNGKETKIPVRPDDTGPAKTNDMATWGRFEEAVETAEEKGYGIGFVFSGADPYLGIDLDGCLRAPDKPANWLPGLDDFVNSTYIERSPSLTGLHIILKETQLPEWWTNQKYGEGDEERGVEVYEESRYFTFTGDLLESSGGSVASDANLESWLKAVWEVFNDDEPWNSSSDYSPDSRVDHTPEPNLDVYDVIRKSKYSPGERHSHPFHGSETGTNFMVDQGGETWRCWRHSVTGNAMHLLGMEQGIIQCGEWAGDGLSPDVWREIFDAGRDAGYQLPEPPNGAPASDFAATDGGTAATSGSDDNSGPKTFEKKVGRRVLAPLRRHKDDDGESITHDQAIDRFADLMTEEYYFIRPREDTRGWRDTLYVYESEDGIYEPFGEHLVETEAERLLGDFASNQRVKEIIGKIERQTRINYRRLETEPERLVVANGILDLQDGELHDHTPDEYHTTMVDIEYREEAECPRIDEFFHDVVDDGDVPTLYRLIAHTLYREYAAEKAAMLLGEGQNGKSVFLSLIEQFLGEWNVSNQSLQALNSDNWAANRLVGKLANIHPDMSDQSVTTMQTFKKLTGRDTISADVKYERPVKFENFATLIFACNRMPVLEDDTRGNWRRWLVIDFPNTFERGDEDFIEKNQLMRELTQEEELEGLLSRAVDEIQEWANGRPWFPKAPDWRESRRRIRRAAEPVYDFAHACLRETDDEDAFVTAEEARLAYRKYASEEGLPPKGREQFGKELLNQSDMMIEKTQRRVSGDRKPAYKGIEFTGRGEELLRDSEENREKLQSRVGDPIGSRERDEIVYRIIENNEGGDGVGQNSVVSMAVDKTELSGKQARHAIDQLAKQGDIIKEGGTVRTL